MQTKYTYKQIWLIAYPILISLLMEQLIGMTDTAFLGRVGEVELGASAIAGVFYMVIFMVAFGFSIGAQILIARRNGERQYKEIGDLFYQGIYFQDVLSGHLFPSRNGGSHVPAILLLLTDYPETHRRFGTYLRSSHQLPALACIRCLLLVQRSHVPCLFLGNHPDQDTDTELYRHGVEQCCIQLYPDFR